jgi:hypothetical protein
VLFDSAVGIHVVQVAIMQIIDMIVVLHCGVSAIWAVLMIMVFVNVSHRIVP